MTDRLSELKYDADAWLRTAKNIEWTKSDTPYEFALDDDTRASYRVWFAALSMSCELWLKYLYAVYAYEIYPHGHKLTEIYDTLPESAKVLLDSRFIYERENNLWEPIVMDAERHANSPFGQDTKTSLTIDASRFRSFFQLLDSTRSDFAPCIDRYQFEQYADTSFTPYLSRSAEQIAEILGRACRPGNHRVLPGDLRLRRHPHARVYFVSTHPIEDDGPTACSPSPM